MPVTDKVSIIFVSCCLEQTRADVLATVLENIRTEIPNEIRNAIVAFDNGSTVSGVTDDLKRTFGTVVGTQTNIGYWSALDWWLKNVVDKKYTYIIESDMVHYDFYKLANCIDLLDRHNDTGACRVQRYSVENKYLFNKDKPHKHSDTNSWQSHVNKVTGKPVTFMHTDILGVYKSTFLTKLPALNRSYVMKNVFDQIYDEKQNGFSELDFQKEYHKWYKVIGVLDGGIFHCNPVMPYGNVVSGSWTPNSTLNSLGYMGTRQAAMFDRKSVTVTTL